MCTALMYLKRLRYLGALCEYIDPNKIAEGGHCGGGHRSTLLIDFQLGGLALAAVLQEIAALCI